MIAQFMIGQIFDLDGWGLTPAPKPLVERLGGG